MSSFMDAVLTRAEMKRIAGGNGNCMICSSRQDGPGGGCGTASYSLTEAKGIIADFTANPPDTNYSYFIAPANCS